MTQFNTPYERENAPRGGPDIPKPGPRPGQPYVEAVFESETFTTGPGGAGSSPYTTLPGWQSRSRKHRQGSGFPCRTGRRSASSQRDCSGSC